MTRKSYGYYDPDPDPGIGLGIFILIGLAVGGIGLWTNPNVINNIMMMLNPELAELEKERLKAQVESIKYICIIIAIAAAAILLFWWMSRKKAKIRTRYVSYGAPLKE